MGNVRLSQVSQIGWAFAASASRSTTIAMPLSIMADFGTTATTGSGFRA
jgi:hypothetical protein